MVWLMFFFFLHFQVNYSLSFSSNSSFTPLCHPDQSFALLKFKYIFSFDPSASSNYCDKSYPKMVSWKEGTDCCSWDGVTCDRVTGHVIGLDLSCSWLNGTIHYNSSLFLLPHLQWLKLNNNYFYGSYLSSQYGRFVSLTHLNLSFSGFSGHIPSKISHLTKLVSLDLSQNWDCKLEPLSLKRLVQNLTDLRELFLDDVNMSSIELGSLMNLSSSLTSLTLQYCGLRGKFPDYFFHRSNLQKLKLGNNYDLIGFFPNVNRSSALETLDLSHTSFSGEIPNSIGNLKSLNYLDLFGCEFSSSVPASVGNLTQITHLGLYFNHFIAEIPSSLSNLGQLNYLWLSGISFGAQFPSSIANLTRLVSLDLSDNTLGGSIPSLLLPNLEYLDLSYNSLNGKIPSWVFTLPSLKYLYLSYNQLSGHIHEFQYNSVRELYLDHNELHGSIPRSIFQLHNLTILLLSTNNLSGIVELDKFVKLKNVRILDLSYNSFSMIANDNFTSTLPGAARQLEQNNNLHFINLHSNLLEGSLPVPPLSTIVFLISDNKLTGKIPSSLCNASLLEVLNLSNNSLSGTIPECLGNFSTGLSVLDLRMNRFYGTIPGTFAMGNWLTNLDLNGNHLEGPVPESLINCRKLEVLDLGNNKIHDTFPNWLDTLPVLQVLDLRSNSFHGPIGNSKNRFPFPKLRIMDLSHNEFIGLLPTKYFQNLKAMMNVDEKNIAQRYIGERSYYHDSVMVMMKGLDIELVKIQTIFTTIDWSDNKFQGEIPKLIGNLNSLLVLNLSHNSLTGQIPPSLGNLTLLESLDLSSNKLNGVIASQLTNLTFLEVLNLSHNHLVGAIPQGKQFDTFENNSYSKNSGLCGLPLSKKCGGDEAPQPPPSIQKEEDSEFGGGFGWKSVLMGYGSGLVLGLAIGYHILLKGEPLWFARIVEGVQHRMTKRLNRSARRQGGTRN